MMKSKKNKRNKAEYFIVGVFVFFMLATLLITYFSNYYLNIYTDIIQNNIEQRLLIECRRIEQVIPYTVIEEFIEPEDMKKTIYINLMHELSSYAKENDLMFIYFMRLVDGQIQYIIDSDENPETHYGLDHYEEPYSVVMKAFNGEPAYNKIGEYIEGWEGILTAYLPVFDERENVVAVIGVDISDEEIVQRKNLSKFLTYLSFVEVGVLVLTSISIIILYRRKATDYNEASAAKSQFLSRMSHEIRTPMNAITGFSKMAKDVEEVEKIDEYIDSINISSDNLLQLINGILDISKIEAGKMKLTVDKVSIKEIVNNIQNTIENEIKLRNHKLTVNIDKNIPDYIYCDKTYLTQIILNLTLNAMKFTEDNGNIFIMVSLIEKKDNSCNLHFAVKDNGIGIEEKSISKLFQPFEQLDGGITRKYGGTGLGLSISKLLIEMMNGKIKVESKIGEGSTFSFDIWVDIVLKEDEPSETEETKEVRNNRL